MSSKPLSMAKDPWLAAGLAALRRARKRAEEIARQTGTPLVLAKDGEPMLVAPEPLGAQEVRESREESRVAKHDR